MRWPSAIMADARVAAAVDRLAALAQRHADDPDRQAQAAPTCSRVYASTRTAAADLVNNVLLASAGMAAFQKLTPGHASRSAR